LYNYLLGHKKEIENVIGQEVEWQELPRKKASRVLIRKDLDPNIKENWGQCFEWYNNYVDKFRKAFTQKILSFNT
ncbi:MAG: DUF4268 domain-containing protein, partial [Thermodesulfobacteriota bacterium]